MCLTNNFFKLKMKRVKYQLIRLKKIQARLIHFVINATMIKSRHYIGIKKTNHHNSKVNKIIFF